MHPSHANQTYNKRKFVMKRIRKMIDVLHITLRSRGMSEKEYRKLGKLVDFKNIYL